MLCKFLGNCPCVCALAGSGVMRLGRGESLDTPPVGPARRTMLPACARSGCGRWQMSCVPCGGKQQVPRRCQCGKRKQLCALHGGRSVCAHGRLQRICVQCSPTGNLWHRVRSATRRVYNCGGVSKQSSTSSVLGCTQRELLAHIDRKMHSWNATHAEQMHSGNIHIDHIKPVASMTESSSIAQMSHYSNLQPLLAHDNARKRDRWSPTDEIWWREHVAGRDSHGQVYWPQACGALNAAGLEWGDLHVLACVAERMQRVA